MAFHVEQRQAGNEIIDKFTRDQPFTVLLAQMQSGKTGTYLFTALEMVRLGLVKNVVIICGSSDTSLRAQTRDDLKTSLKSFLEEKEEEGDTKGTGFTDGTFLMFVHIMCLHPHECHINFFCSHDDIYTFTISPLIQFHTSLSNVNRKCQLAQTKTIQNETNVI